MSAKRAYRTIRLGLARDAFHVANANLVGARRENRHPRRALVEKRNKALARVRKWEHLLAELDDGPKRPAEVFVVSVANQSERSVRVPQLIVLHDTEGGNIPGVADLRGLANWFDRPSTKASAHVGVDAEGLSAQFVPDNRKAWHCAAYNSVSLGIEQIGYATQQYWPDKQLDKVAEYIAYWCAKYNIPVAHSIEHGICRHSDLKAAGGGHHDPGENYPFNAVLERVRRLRASA